MKIRIATRLSPLAMLQTKEVIERIKFFDPRCVCEIIKIESEGDLTDAPLHTIGGKGLFVSKLEMALENGSADIAVHSLKDVPALINSKFTIAATLAREEPIDALLLKEGLTINDLSKNLNIATSGPRRRSQLLAINPKLNIKPIRGNIQTRINKLQTDNLDGLVVAKAALNRLKILHPNVHVFTEEQMLPAAAQGAIGIEVKSTDISPYLSDLLGLVNDRLTFQSTEIERLVVASLEGNCLSPISALCKIDNQDVELKVRVSNQDGTEVHNELTRFKLKNKIDAVNNFIETLIRKGVKEIIQR
ncbi:hydroxymethylbilane synthase [Gammaproteobacteria bacterium]|jgi:hydroxymethylbilane synthase|nr:hydroxymethylbilane synthase [Gammaproteobacteria bacterium]MDB2629223.1 hydroxymethylbilane synthase [Gammaproteobacteria bacterium]